MDASKTWLACARHRHLYRWWRTRWMRKGGKHQRYAASQSARWRRSARGRRDIEFRRNSRCGCRSGRGRYRASSRHQPSGQWWIRPKQPDADKYWSGRPGQLLRTLVLGHRRVWRSARRNSRFDGRLCSLAGRGGCRRRAVASGRSWKDASINRRRRHHGLFRRVEGNHCDGGRFDFERR